MLRKESEEQKQKSLDTIKSHYDLLDTLRNNQFSGRIDRSTRIDLRDAAKYIDPKRSYCLSCGGSMRPMAIMMLHYYDEHQS